MVIVIACWDVGTWERLPSRFHSFHETGSALFCWSGPESKRDGGGNGSNRSSVLRGLDDELRARRVSFIRQHYWAILDRDMDDEVRGSAQWWWMVA